MRTYILLLGFCFVAFGCGDSGGDPGGGGTGATGATGATGGGGQGGGGAGGGGICPSSSLEISPKPWSVVACEPATLTTFGEPLEVAMIPGWERQLLIEHATIYASSHPLDGGCTLESEYTFLIAKGGATPPSDDSAWTQIKMNPQIPPDPNPELLSLVELDFPEQSILPGENLFIGVLTTTPDGRFCPGLCANAAGFAWHGAGTSALLGASYQIRAEAKGRTPFGCGQGLLHNNTAVCATENLSALSAAPAEDGDLAVERLIAKEDVHVEQILLEMVDGGDCALPSEVELIYFVGEATAPVGMDWTEVKIPMSTVYRLSNGGGLFSHKLESPLLLPAGKALYAGIRQHPTPNGTCLTTCGGPKVSDGDSWWGHTHTVPGEVEWKSLASENFPVTLRLMAVTSQP